MEKGDAGVVFVGTDQVAQVNSFDINEEGRTQEVQVGGTGGAVDERVTLVRTSGVINGFSLAADAGQNALTVGATVTLELRRNGTGPGLPQQRIVGAQVTGVSRPWDVNSYNAVSFTWVGGASDNTAQAQP